jgi:sulfide:quinone oxidoreductase
MIARGASGTVRHMTSSAPAHHRVVVAGGGIAGLEALIALRRQAPELTRVTLVSPRDTFAYRPLGVEEPFGGRTGRRHALPSIAAGLRATYVRDGLASVDPAAGTVALRSGGTLAYDSLIVALGAHAYPAFGHGITFDRAREREAFDELLSDIDARLVPHVAVVVPEHVGWTLPAYELAFATRAYGASPRGREVAVTLVTHERQPLAAFGTSVSRTVARILAEAGVEVACGRDALVMSDTALIAGGRWLTAERIVALPRVAGPRPAGLPSDLHGFVPVDDHARVAGLDGVYAAGDATAGPVKQGGIAAQQAGAAVDHIIARLRGEPEPDPAAPVLRGVLNTPRGTLYLQAELGPGRAGEGSLASWEPLWSAPGRVASKWLSEYLGAATPLPVPAAAG